MRKVEHHNLTAPNCYFFWCKEDTIAKLDITIVEKIVSKADLENYPDDVDKYSGLYYHEGFGWDEVYSQGVDLRKEHFELICMLEDIDKVELTDRMKGFMKKAIMRLFEKKFKPH